MKSLLLSTVLVAGLTAPALAADTYVLDPSHSQIVFTYNHLGYSTTTGMFSGFEGEISWDVEAPAQSTVKVSMPVTSMITGWEERTAHFMSADFFDAADDEVWSFESTGIEVTGENSALITGDLTLNGVTKSVVLDATLNQKGTHPMMNQDWAGFDATATLLRSDYGLGAFAPYISDEVQLRISVEAMKAESDPS